MVWGETCGISVRARDLGLPGRDDLRPRDHSARASRLRPAGRPRRALGYLLVAFVLSVFAQSPAASAAPVHQYPASVAIGKRARQIPRAFLGLSVEYPEVAQFAQLRGPVSNTLKLLQGGDRSPLILRIGGGSADRTWWQAPSEPPLPVGVLGIGPPWLAQLRALVAQNHLRAILDLNLAAHAPAMAAGFVAAAKAALGQNLAGLEVGNEPDHYQREPWLLRQLPIATESGLSSHWNRGYTPRAYARDYRAYAQTLKNAYPHLPIGAPDLATPAVRWLAPLLRTGRLHPNFLSVHRYASSSCWPKDSPRYPSIPLLLSNRVSTGLADGIGHELAFARAHGIALRIGEMGTISCGGNKGVANSFATALWAPDVLFEFLQAGASGVNWHLRPDAWNAPFAFTGSSIQARPALYGMAMFAQVIGGEGGALLRSSVTAPGLNLKVWSVEHPHAKEVLILNKGYRTAAVSVGSVRARWVSVGRLTAPGSRATRGVHFEGRWIGSDGRWHGRRRIVRVATHAAVVHVSVPGISGALLTFR